MKKVTTITSTASVQSAAEKMLECDVNCLPVVDESGKMVGILTEGDLFRHVAGSRSCLPHEQDRKGDRQEIGAYTVRNLWPVRNVMSSAVVTAEPNDDGRKIAAVMLSSKIKHMPVLDDGAVVGIVSRFELLCEIVDAPLNILACGNDNLLLRRNSVV